jgi:hypothetical protein
MRFGDRRVQAREMQQPEVHDGSVEDTVVERERLRVTLAELEVRIAAPRLRHHQRREVEPDDARTPRRRHPGDVPRTGRDIDQTHPRSHGDRLEQRAGRLRGQGSERLGVVPGSLLPAIPFEIVKRRRV